MDYKVTVLQNAVELKDSLIEDFPDLLFGTMPDQTVVFDATEYLNRTNEHHTFNVRLFMRAVKPFIESFISAYGLDASKLFYQSANGHALIHEELVFLFLSFSDKIWVAYFNSLLSDAINKGVAYSDTYTLKLAAERIPSDVLQKLIDSRKEEENDDGTTDD